MSDYRIETRESFWFVGVGGAGPYFDPKRPKDNWVVSLWEELFRKEGVLPDVVDRTAYISPCPNVRGRISEIRRALWPERTDPNFGNGLELVSASGYRFDLDAPFWIDVVWFERYLESANDSYRHEMWQIALEDYSRAHALYRGDFLVDDLDQPWTDDIRERLRLEYQSSLVRAAECHVHLGQYRQAAAAAQRAREIDPLDEEAYRLQIVAFGHIPDKAAALDVYEELVVALRDISEEPDPEISELIERIKQGSLKPGTPEPRHNLRQPLTAFFGREQELAVLNEQLTDSRTRVVTLLGPGGIGKTRLAVEVGRQLAPTFRDGVFYVPVAEYRSVQGLAAGIAQAIGFSSTRPNSSVAELADFLSNKEMLLIIDAAEHAEDAAPLVDTLLRCPGVKLLVTSRSRLHVPGEFIIDIRGLPYPADPESYTSERRTTSPDTTPAYRLFVDRYSRLRPRFRPTEEDRDAISRACRLVEGMPLAIEMAASWGRVFTCREIAERIASFENLADTLDDQYQGIRSVFSFSWQMLTDTEQHAALRLSSFAGSFSRPAAEHVADCPASTIMSLGDKSFVRLESHGRFRIHEVIRGYLRRELASDPDAEALARQVHADYFAARLDSDPAAASSQDLIRELRHDLPNIQQSWRWWISRMDVGTLQRTLRSVVHLHETLDQWSAAVELLETAIAGARARTQALDGSDDHAGGPATANAPSHEAGHSAGHVPDHAGGNAPAHAGDHEAGNAPGHAPGHAAGNAPGHARGHAPGHAAGHAEDHAAGNAPGHARGHAAGNTPGHALGHAPGHAAGHARDHAAGHGPRKNELMLLCAALLTHLGYVAMRLGDLSRAETALSDGTELLEALNPSADAHTDAVVAPDAETASDAFSRTKAHTEAMHRMVSGWLSLDRADSARATARLTSAVEELHALGDEWRRAGAMSLLATQARRSGEFDRSRRLYEESLAIHERLGDTRAIAGILLNLGAVYGDLQQYEESERYFKEARRYAEEGGHRLLLFFVIGNSGFLAYRRSLLAEAESLCREALDLAVDLGLKSGQAQIAYYLALIALDRREPRHALPYLRQALDQSLNARTLQLTLQAIHGYARYFALMGENEDAAALLYFVMDQPSYPLAARTRSEEVLAAVTPTLSAPQIASAERKATEQDLDAFVAELRRLGDAD